MQGHLTADPMGSKLKKTFCYPGHLMMQFFAYYGGTGGLYVATHVSTFDKRYPEFLPARHDFLKSVDDLKRIGAHPAPYINALIWDTWFTESWHTANAERAEVKNLNGSSKRWYAHHTLMTLMCPATSRWRETVLDNSRKTLIDYGCSGIYFCHGVQQASVTGSIITDGRFAGIGGLGTGARNDRYITISNNVIHNMTNCGIQFYKTSVDKGVQGKFITIGNNSFRNIGNVGVSILGAEHIGVTGNHFENCTSGVALRESSYCNLTGNIFAGGETGVHIDKACRCNLVTGNVFTGQAEPVELADGAADNVVQSNLVAAGTHGQPANGRK